MLTSALSLSPDPREDGVSGLSAFDSAFCCSSFSAARLLELEPDCSAFCEPLLFPLFCAAGSSALSGASALSSALVSGSAETALCCFDSSLFFSLLFASPLEAVSSPATEEVVSFASEDDCFTLLCVGVASGVAPASLLSPQADSPSTKATSMIANNSLILDNFIHL